MKKASSSKKRRNPNVAPESEFKSSGIKELIPLNFAQGQYLTAINSNDIIFGVGSAGTGKTFISSGYAARELYYRNISKIILTRPNIEVGRGLGFLPGELAEKYAPYLAPFEDIFTEYLGKGLYQYALKSGAISPQPLGFMRGATFDNCIVLCDEMQNATAKEFQMVLSRIGKNCKMIISGDPFQTDIHNSGLADAVSRLGSIKGIEVVNFLPQDIVRSEMCKSIILAYNSN